MLFAMVTNENHMYTPVASSTFPLFEVKFPCAMALHFMLYPEVFDALLLMKFAVKETHQFVGGGAFITFGLAFGKFFNAVLCEFINIYLLSYQHTI